MQTTLLPLIDKEKDMKISISTDATGNKSLKLKHVDAPEIKFTYSPYLLKLPQDTYKKFSHQLISLSRDSFNVEVVEDKYQPGNNFPEQADIKLEFANYQTLLDFIYKKDEEFFEELKFIINDIAAARNDDPDLIMLAGLHLVFNMQFKEQKINATLAIMNKDLEINNKINQRIEQGMQYISELRTHIKINQVLLAATENWPYWKFLAFNSSDGSGYDSVSKKYQNYLQL
jgi:hypothetical protein